MQQRDSTTPQEQPTPAVMQSQPAPVVAVHQHQKRLAIPQVAVQGLANVDGHHRTGVDGHASRTSAVHTPAQKLERARQRVREALKLAADETPSYAVLDDIARSLSLATRELEELAVSIAVLQRREVHG